MDSKFQSHFAVRLRPVFFQLFLLVSSAALAAESGHDFAKWENEISAFEQADHTNPPPKKGVLFIGSSTVRLWKSLAADFPDQNVINRGFGGSQIVDATHFAHRVIFPCEPRMIFLRAGSNDIHAGKTPEQVFDEFKEFVATVRSKLPDAEITYISGWPTIARLEQADKEAALNKFIADFAAQTPHVHYLDCWNLTLGTDGKPRPDIFSDKLHLNDEGYQLLAARLRPCLRDKAEGGK